MIVYSGNAVQAEPLATLNVLYANRAHGLQCTRSSAHVASASRSRSLPGLRTLRHGARTRDHRWRHRLPIPVIWIGSVLLVRLVHLTLIGDAAVPFNNARLIVQAKAVVCHGLENAFFSVPPAANLLLAGLAYVSNLSAGDAFFLLALALHVLLAVSFWYWLSAMRWPAEINRLAMWVFVWLPVFNSYEGFDNISVLGAAAGFLTMVGSLHRLARADRIGPKACCAVLFPTAAMVMFRAEYLLFTSLYLVIWASCPWITHRYRALSRVSLRRIGSAGLVLICGFGFGVGLTIWIRGVSSGEYLLAGRGYSCWTLLDGVPLSWMPTEDHSYTARVRVARRYFGDPADYDYSLVRMVVAHPGTIAVKMLHNLPRWLSELGRRHVVLPVPAMAVLLTGLFWMARSRRRRHTCLQLMATIVMTIPVTVLYTHAEYMTPAFVGATVGIACGLAFFSRRVVSACTVLGVPLTRRWATRICLTLFCLSMEGLLLRGGGLFADFQSRRAIAKTIDETLESIQVRTVWLDPYSMELDSYSRADIRNRIAQFSDWRAQQAQVSSSLPWPSSTVTIDVMDLVDRRSFDGQPALPVVLWDDSENARQVCQNRKASWSRHGYTEVITVNSDHPHRPFTVMVLMPATVVSGASDE